MADYDARAVRHFGKEVRRLREERGWTQEGLGAMGRIRCTGGFVSQIETGRRRPRPEMAVALDEVFEVDHFARIWDNLIKKDDQWPDYFATYAELERRATYIHRYAALLVPGLLQTAEYARAIFRAYRPHAEDAEIEAEVDKRLGRAAILSEPNRPGVWAVLDEAVLRRVVGGPDAMRQQLAHILDLVRTRRLVVQILPYLAGAYAAMEGPLTILEFADAPPVAYTEAQATSRLLDDPADVRARRADYDLAKAVALPPEASVEFIQNVMKEYDA